jgi:hypothetical protein
VLAHAIARSLDLDDDGMMEQAVEQRSGDDLVAEHAEMPQHLIVESLGSGWLIRITRCMAGVIRSANDAQGGD